MSQSCFPSLPEMAHTQNTPAVKPRVRTGPAASAKPQNDEVAEIIGTATEAAGIGHAIFKIFQTKKGGGDVSQMLPAVVSQLLPRLVQCVQRLVRRATGKSAAQIVPPGYISLDEAEQREREAYLRGRNAAIEAQWDRNLDCIDRL